MVRTLIGMSGALSVILMLKVLTENIVCSKFEGFVSYIGNMTLGIYCVQVFFAEGVLKYFSTFGQQIIPSNGTWIEHMIYDFIITPVVAVVIIYLCIRIISFIKRSKYLKLMLLGEK